MPGEELEVTAVGGDLFSSAVKEIQPYFIVVELEAATQAFCEDAADFTVTQAGRELPNGHQRQPCQGG